MNIYFLYFLVSFAINYDTTCMLTGHLATLYIIPVFLGCKRLAYTLNGLRHVTKTIMLPGSFAKVLPMMNQVLKVLKADLHST